MLRALYFNDWVRIPVKFVLTFTLLKLGFDYSEYRTAYRSRRTNPRFVTYSISSVALINNLQRLPPSLSHTLIIKPMISMRF